MNSNELRIKCFFSCQDREQSAISFFLDRAYYTIEKLVGLQSRLFLSLSRVPKTILFLMRWRAVKQKILLAALSQKELRKYFFF